MDKKSNKIKIKYDKLMKHGNGILQNKKSNNNIMENRNDLLRKFLSSLNSLSADELKQFLTLTNKIKSNRKPKPRNKNIEIDVKKPVPAPRKSVKQMVKDYEKITKPTPMTRTKIEQTEKALKGYTKSYEINVKNKKDALVQLQNTRTALAYHIKMY